VVLSGTIHMLKEDLWGEQTLLTYITAGDLIGELFAVTKSTRSYVTFTAASDALVLFIPAYNIIHSCPNQCSFHATLTQNMFHILGMKSMRLLERIEISSRSSLREKILAYLSLLAQRQDTRYVKSPLGRTELADYLDANRSALTRELANMKRDGIIDFDRNTFLIKAAVRSD
jgi:CRP-like cAMP-binding protein